MIKQKCAREALNYIKDGMIIGLGGGSTIGHLVKYIKENNLDVKIVTPSYQTAELCVDYHLNVVPTWSVDYVDIAFDGCDEVDLNLNALKSGGSIHTSEKIIASMAKDYVLLVDESKVFETLAFNHPVVIEVIPESMRYVKKELEKLDAVVSMRQASNKDGYIVSDHGNFIMEAKFSSNQDIKALDEKLKHITGIVETSLFVDKVSFILVADENSVKVVK